MTQKEKEQDAQESLERKSIEEKIETLVDEVCETAISEERWVLHRQGNAPDPPRIYLKPEDRKKLVSKYVELLI
jgi:hypothetical protein